MKVTEQLCRFCKTRFTILTVRRAGERIHLGRCHGCNTSYRTTATDREES